MNFRKAVKEISPGAICQGKKDLRKVITTYVVYEGVNDLGCGDTKSAAWKDAYEKLKSKHNEKDRQISM